MAPRYGNRHRSSGFPPVSLKLQLENLPPGIQTGDIYRHFHEFGDIEYIRIEDAQIGIATLTFSPPPPNQFFLQKDHHLFAGDSDPYLLRIRIIEQSNGPVDSPLDRHRRFPAQVLLRPSGLIYGAPINDNELTLLRGFNTHAKHPITLNLRIDGGKQDLSINFPIQPPGLVIPYQLQARFANIEKVLLANGLNGTKYVVITFQYPPRYSVIDMEHSGPQSEDAIRWTRGRSFYRVTDIDYDMRQRLRTPVSLTRKNPIIDPGRWLTISMKIDPKFNSKWCWDTMLDILHAHNVKIVEGTHIVRSAGGPSPWQVFDTDQHIKESAETSNALDTLQQGAATFPILTFDVRYRLEVCLSKGLIQEGTISKPFLWELAELEQARAMDLLDNLVNAGRKMHDPMELFNIPELRARRKRRIPKTCVLMHSVTVTPTTIYVNPVQVEVSNRVVRKFSELADHFMRVRFTDELYNGPLQSQKDDGKDAEVFERVRRALVNGIRIAGRQYIFLASGNSQFREKGAYFFSQTEQVTVNSIRQWMGYVQGIREIPKYISRIGQCFSTTRAVTSIGQQPQIVEIPDIERNGYNFTDGVGKMSKFLAHMISQELRLGPEAPSLFQFRMGGCKGVLVVDPTVQGRAVHIRPSQKKFESDFNQLEIIRVSAFASAYLNRQIILVMSALGVADGVFVKKMRQQLAQINQALEDDEVALNMLQRNVDFNQITTAISKMIAGGMRGDPFVDSMLHLWRSWMVKWLKEKANLFVPDGAFVLGCVDETATLRMDSEEMPEIFIQVPDGKGGYKVIQDTCIIARNPALHPGDIRVVKAVDCPKLHHLKDVVVVPQLGERDLANMCAGGDLDGDDFLVIWDPDLIPLDTTHEPMDYTAPKAVKARGPVTQSDIIQFFCDYMRNDSLGSIAVNHRYWADLLDAGVKHSKCIELAKLHSQAVDYPKTGVPARMTPDLYTEQLPHWSEKNYRIYKSRKVLGKLYDEVEHVIFKPQYHRGFDARIIQVYERLEKLPEEAFDRLLELKAEYDEDMRRIMAQYGVNTEFEVWSAFVMEHNRQIKDYKFAEELGKLMTALKHHYRDACDEVLGTHLHAPDRHQKIAPMVATLYKMVADQVVDYTVNREFHMQEDTPTPMMSFPWVFQDELIGLATMADNPDMSLTEAMTKQNVIAARRRRVGGACRFDHPSSHFAPTNAAVEGMSKLSLNLNTGSGTTSGGSGMSSPSKHASSRSDSPSSSVSSGAGWPQDKGKGKARAVDVGVQDHRNMHEEIEEEGDIPGEVLQAGQNDWRKLEAMLGED